MAEMIGITAAMQDGNGGVTFPILAESRIFGGSRRVSRTQTLDGGCVINDGGFSHGDRTLQIVTPYEENRWNVLWNLTQNHTQVTVSTREGLFLGTIENLDEEDRKIRIRVLLKEKLSP
mgnify:FL=1